MSDDHEVKELMFFEGSEKKLEIIVTPVAANLRQLDLSFWSSLVRCANADILSTLKSEHCDAYLLSESSLFVWDDRILILTCGNSMLVNAACYFIDKLMVNNIALVSYQRKNEYHSHLQNSTFADDIVQLRRLISGKAFRIGHLDSHHHYFFCSEGRYHAQSDDNTLELLMYHIRGEFADYLNGEVQTKSEICAWLELDRLFPEFTFDAHLFEPYGFSMNGLWEKYCITLHITPQAGQAYGCSYVSFETNLDLSLYPYAVLEHLLSVFSPVSWDVIGFNHPIETQVFPAHLCLGSCSLTTEQGYNIRFNHYQQCQIEVLIPEVM